MTKNLHLNHLSYSGYCNECNKTHSLPPDKAIPHCVELMKRLQAHCRIDFDISIDNANPKLTTQHLYSVSGGQMFGVLVCEDVNGNQIILKAFSSTHNGVWSVEGWVAHLADETKFMAIVNEGNTEIHPLTSYIQTLTKTSEEWNAKIIERKKISQKILSQLLELYEISNFKNQKRNISNAFNIKKGIPNGTGDCCAPKLLNYAAIHNLKPISIAEFYWGKESLSGLRKEGEFYSSCKDKCEPLLGFMLCGLNK
ncbi:MAG: hypothetical protein Q7W45_08175 [Bacteroidota bacterium]|nr:hypothetical protein [Bacteroidota bacterium]MDP3146402.1 hypothetical protein [Bacteroidota bacterium]